MGREHRTKWNGGEKETFEKKKPKQNRSGSTEQGLTGKRVAAAENIWSGWRQSDEHLQLWHVNERRVSNPFIIWGGDKSQNHPHPQKTRALHCHQLHLAILRTFWFNSGCNCHEEKMWCNMEIVARGCNAMLRHNVLNW